MSEWVAVFLAFLIGALNARRVDVWADRAGWWLRRRIRMRWEPRAESVLVTPEGAGWLVLAVNQLALNEAIGTDTIKRMRRETQHTIAECKSIEKRYEETA